MPNDLNLDESYSDMTGQWKKGGQYRVELLITQTSKPGTPFKATIDEVLDYGDAEVEVEEEPAPPATPKKPPVKTAPAPYPPEE